MLFAALLGGCGGGSSTHTTKKAAGGATIAPPSATATSTSSSPSSHDCDTLGINPVGMREGTCTHAGITWVIVDQSHTLKLKTLWARLAGVRASKTLRSASGAMSASGDFVIASVTITNKLPGPQTFDASGTQQAGLVLDRAVFKESATAESQADASSCLRLATPIQPEHSETCDVIFEVPSSAAADLGKHGSGDLYLVNFGSDLTGSVLPQTIGQIRLYH